MTIRTHSYSRKLDEQGTLVSFSYNTSNLGFLVSTQIKLKSGTIIHSRFDVDKAIFLDYFLGNQKFIFIAKEIEKIMDNDRNLPHGRTRKITSPLFKNVSRQLQQQ